MLLSRNSIILTLFRTIDRLTEREFMKKQILLNADQIDLINQMLNAREDELENEMKENSDVGAFLLNQEVIKEKSAVKKLRAELKLGSWIE